MQPSGINPHSFICVIINICGNVTVHTNVITIQDYVAWNWIFNFCWVMSGDLLCSWWLRFATLSDLYCLTEGSNCSKNVSYTYKNEGNFSTEHHKNKLSEKNKLLILLKWAITVFLPYISASLPRVILLLNASIIRSTAFTDRKMGGGVGVRGGGRWGWRYCQKKRGYFFPVRVVTRWCSRFSGVNCRGTISAGERFPLFARGGPADTSLWINVDFKLI